MTLGFRAKLLLATASLVAVSELLTVAALDRSVSSELVAQTQRRLEQQARGSIEWVSVGRHPDEIAARLGRISAAGVTLADAHGVVVGDSGHEPVEGEARASIETAPEFVEARAGRVGSDVRDNVLYVAVLAAASDGSSLVIRMGAPLADVDATIGLMRKRLLIASAVVFLLAVAVTLAIARVFARPLVEMRDAAHAIAAGSFSVKVAAGGDDELGDLARSLTKLAEQLGQTDAMRRQFLSDVSHEIGTPVTAIQGYAETLLAGKSDAAATREFTEIIHRHARRIGRLVADLSFLASLEAKKPAQRIVEDVALAELVQYVEQTVRKRADDKRVTLAVDVADDVNVRGDADHVERVLLNLVENAVKYGKDGGAVSVTGRKEGARVSIVVADDGPGIPADSVARVFERFYRVDIGRSRDQGGSGLGLAIVKELVESMGGTASVASEPGKGARFTVTLPAA